MDFLWTDWRKTALGALALALAAVLFTHEGGVAETAVTGAEDLAGRKQAEIIAGAEAHKTWFAMDENSYPVEPVAPPPRAAATTQPLPLTQNVVRNQEPVGRDFPPELKPPT